LRGLSFEVATGEVFGLLGPNGAGKTTTVEILGGLRPRTTGEVSVLGYDPADDSDRVKDRIGVCLQDTNLPDKMKVHEALHVFSTFYTRTTDPDKILERLQLTDKRDAYFGQLSGGQKQRLALGLALINDPRLLFLDEPTTGLDPQVRLEIHGLIQELKEANRTIVLTTHYIEEAEKLCDRVAIVNEGRIVAIGTPREIQSAALSHSKIQMHFVHPLPDGQALPPVEAESIQVDEERRSLVALTKQPTRTLVDLVKWIDSQGLELSDIQLKQPTLEDAFIELTGKRLRE